MSEERSEITPSKEKFPEDSEKRFEALFAAIGNSEAKCLTLLCLSESPITSEDLMGKFRETSKNVWKGKSSSSVRNYCRQTLSPTGLVAEVDMMSTFGSLETVTGYRLTEAGKKYGQPI